MTSWFDIDNNIPAFLTESIFNRTGWPIQAVYGIKINWLVLLYIAYVGWYAFFYKFKAYQSLRQACATLKKFASELDHDSLPAEADLKSHLQDYFRPAEEEMAVSSLSMNIQLQHAWKEFAEGIEPCPKGSSQLFNVYQADDFFTRDLLIKPFTLPLSHASGLFTSTGLLFTFIALGAGMSSLTYQDGGKIDGLGDFINALSGKFVTSILGLVIALSVDGVIRRQEHAMEEALAAIVYGLNRRVKRLTAQSILTEINASVKSLPEKIETLLNKSHQDDGIMAQLKETIETSLKGVIDEHVTSIQQDLAAITANLAGFGDDGAAQLTEVMTQLGRQLKEAITSGVSSDISQLTDTLAGLPRIMEASQISLETLQHTITESQAMMLSSVKEILGSVTAESKGSLEGVLRQLQENAATFQSETLAYQAQQQEKNRESLQALTDMLAALRSRQSDQASQMDASMASAIERLETSLSQSQTRTAEAFTTLQASNAQLLEQMRDTLQTTSTQAASQMQQQQALTVDTLNTQRTEVDGQLASLRQTLLDTQRQAQEELVGGVTRLFETQQALLTPLLTELQQSFKGFEQVGEALPNRIRETEQAIADAMTQLRAFMQEHMTPFVEQASQLTQDQHRLTGEQERRFIQLQDLQQSLLTGQITLGSVIK